MLMNIGFGAKLSAARLRFVQGQSNSILQNY